MTKQQQRAEIKERLRLMTRSDRETFSHVICQRLLRLPELENAHVVFSYLATDEEANVDEFNRILTERGIVVCFPVIRGDDMQAYYSPQENYTLNGYGIREPERHASILIDREAIDLVIVPCVGFDERMNRLGRGKGYYDRYLEGLEVPKVAVAFEAQKLEHVETSVNDVIMNKIITEADVYRFIKLMG